MKETEPVYEMSLLDKVTGDITLKKMRHATNQIASLLSLHHCDIDESKGYGHAWLVMENGTWLAKNGVEHPVPVPTKPANFSGTTETEKFMYKLKLKQYNDYKTHSNGAVKMIKYIFEESCFLNLEDEQGQMIGHTPHQIITHICDNEITQGDHDLLLLLSILILFLINLMYVHYPLQMNKMHQLI